MNLIPLQKFIIIQRVDTIDYMSGWTPPNKKSPKGGEFFPCTVPTKEYKYALLPIG